MNKTLEKLLNTKYFQALQLCEVTRQVQYHLGEKAKREEVDWLRVPSEIHHALGQHRWIALFD